MKKTKHPVLTSPSKIGFLVSLMLVFVSIGVSYFFTRRFGISWNVLERDWLDGSEWTGVIRGEGFLFEVLPLVGLVVVASAFAYLLITGAVRKYKRYLDSGYDYRNLLSTLKDLDNLEDKRKIERINNHPELKRLLLGLAEANEERERLLGEREGALETRLQDALRTKEAEMAESFSRECERLAKAVESGTVDPSAIEFSNTGLRRLAEVAGQVSLPPASPPRPDITESCGDLREASDVLHSKLREVAAELRTGCEGAQEIETRLRTLVTRERGDAGRSRLDDARKEIKAVVTSLRSIEQVNLVVDALSEEAKGIAINTALHAGSGAGTQDDLIRLAEEVKELASRFKEAARQFAQSSSAVRASVGALDSIAGGPIDRSDHSAPPEENLAAVLSQVSLWVERVVVLADKVSSFGRSDDVPMGTTPGTGYEPFPDGYPAAAPFAETPSVEKAQEPWAERTVEDGEFGFESLERSQSLFGEGDRTPSKRPDSTSAGTRGIFEEIPSEMGRRFGIPESEAELPDRGALAVDRTSAGTGAGPGEPVLLPADENLAGSSERSGDSVAVGPQEPQDAPAETPLEEDVVDLYAIGAVDYDPALHG